MNIGPVDAKAGSDRFSTCDEIRAALSSFPEMYLDTSKDNLWEVESDMGGRVLIETEEPEVMELLERLDGLAN
jgi:hypothetical protein